MKVPVKRRAQIGAQRRTRTRERIFNAAFDLLGRENGRLTRIEEICTAADVSRGTFYNYFTSMDELFTSLSLRISHRYNLLVREVAAARPSAAERIAFAVRYYLQWARTDRAWAWAMVNLSAGGPILGEEVFARATAAVADGIAQGEFTVPNAQLGRDLLLGCTLASMISILRTRSSEFSPEVVVRQILVGLGAHPKLIERALKHALPDLGTAVAGSHSKPAVRT